MAETYMVADMPAAEYHATEAASAGFLKKMKRSPYHAHYSRQNPTEPTAAMRFGTAWHTAFFEPDRFMSEYVPVPEGLDRRTKEGKALWAEIEASGKVPLSPAEVRDLDAMVTAARAHPISRVIADPALKAMAEPSIFSRDPVTGVVVRIRPDLLIPPCVAFPNGLVIDGKTTLDASPEGFARSVWNLDYHLQAALYPEVVQRLYGTQQPPAFIWLAAEKDAPHCCAYYSAGDNLIQHGRREVRGLLMLYAECLRTGIWPGYSTDVAPLEMPVWAEKQMADAA